MGIFASDQFTGTADTAITGRTPDVGGAWTQPTGFTQELLISNANRLRQGGNGGSSTRVYYANTAPGTPDYDVVSDVIQISSTNRILGPAGRIQAADGQCYAALYSTTSGTIALVLFASTTSNSTLASYTTTLSLNTTYSLKLEMRGSAIKVYLDGVQIISVTNSTVASAGFAGVASTNTSNSGSNTNGTHLDNWVASTPASDQSLTHTSLYRPRALGAHTLTKGTPKALAHSALTRPRQFGAHALAKGTPKSLATSGIQRPHPFGAHTLTKGAAQALATSSLTRPRAFGAHALAIITGTTIQPLGISRPRAFGTHSLATGVGQTIQISTLSRPSAIGSHTIANVSLGAIIAAGLTRPRAFGTHALAIRSPIAPTLAAAMVRFLRTVPTVTALVSPTQITASKGKATGTQEPHIVVDERSTGEHRVDSHASVTETILGISCHHPTEAGAESIANAARDAIFEGKGIRLEYARVITTPAKEGGETSKTELPARAPGMAPLWKSELPINFRCIRAL